MAWGDGGSMKVRASQAGNGFWNLPGEERAAAERAACERYGAEDFFDLDPEQRRETYESATSAP